MELPNQIFSLLDLPLVGMLIFLEILLSSDNAAVMACFAKKLPVEKRRKALFVGMFSGFILRAIGIIVASFLIQLFWIKIIGGGYLIFLSIKQIISLRKNRAFKKQTQKKYSFWRVVVSIEATDILFAIDSILAAFALAAIYYPHQILYTKLWVIYLGGIIGMVTMRYAARGFMTLMDSYPGFEKIIFIAIGWMGLKLIFEGGFHFTSDFVIKQWVDFLFWIGSILILVVGFLFTKWYKKKASL